MSYCERKWLNPEGHPSTGSVVAYHGEAPWNKENIAILEISDCHNKVRLHQSDLDTLADFREKMIRLRDVVSRYVDHLTDEINKETELETELKDDEETK